MRGRFLAMEYGASLCVALLILLSWGRWALTATAAQKTASQSDDTSRFDETAPKSRSQYWSPSGLADETPQQLREKEALLRLIERVQAIRLSRRKPVSSQSTEPNAPTAAIDAAPVAAPGTAPSEIPEPNGVSSADPNKTQAEIRSTPVPVPTTPKPEPPPTLPAMEPNDTIAHMLALLETLSGHDDEIDKPFEMAELLRQSGFLSEAAAYYRVALERLTIDDPETQRRRAWTLFQAGSCVRREDPAEAGRMFQQLVTEHPESIWKEAAEIWLPLVDWYATVKPEELIESLQ